MASKLERPGRFLAFARVDIASKSCFNFYNSDALETSWTHGPETQNSTPLIRVLHKKDTVRETSTSGQDCATAGIKVWARPCVREHAFADMQACISGTHIHPDVSAEEPSSLGVADAERATFSSAATRAMPQLRSSRQAGVECRKVKNFNTGGRLRYLWYRMGLVQVLQRDAESWNSCLPKKLHCSHKRK